MDLVETLKDLSTAKVLIVIGVLLIVLYFVGRLGQWVALPDSRRMPALIVGAVLLCAGVTLELIAKPPADATPAPVAGPVRSNTPVSRPAGQASAYYVVMGSFANRSGAETRVNDARSAGIDATIMPGASLGLTAGNFVVAIGPFERSRADEKVAKTKATFASAYLKQAP